MESFSGWCPRAQAGLRPSYTRSLTTDTRMASIAQQPCAGQLGNLYGLSVCFDNRRLDCEGGEPTGEYGLVFELWPASCRPPGGASTVIHRHAYSWGSCGSFVGLSSTLWPSTQTIISMPLAGGRDDPGYNTGQIISFSQGAISGCADIFYNVSVNRHAVMSTAPWYTAEASARPSETKAWSGSTTRSSKRRNGACHPPGHCDILRESRTFLG